MGTFLNGVVDVERAQYNASLAMVVYLLNKAQKEGDDMGNISRLPGSYVSLHSIRDGMVCEGAPISKKTLLNLCRKVLPSLGEKTQYIPDHVLGYTAYPSSLVWWMPGGVKTLFFDQSMGIKNGKAPVPPMLFRYTNGFLTVFALRENKRPTPDTVLYQSPFWNWGCMGNVSLPKDPRPSDTGKFEKLYWRSAFSGHNPPKLKGTTGAELWKSLVGSGKEKFPVNCLLKAGKLREILEDIDDDE